MKPQPVLLAFLAWFIVGTTVAAAAQVLRAEARGGMEGLVFAGALEPAHVVVMEHLPSAPVSDDEGHDGQIFFAVATDLTAAETSPSIVSPYRYRRIMYPALSSLFGVLDGRSLVWGMAVVASTSVGLAAGAVGGIASALRLHWLAPLLVVLNPGTWLSAILLTADNLALAFGFLAVLAFVRRRDGWAFLALALAALTKETHILFAIGLSGYLWFEGDRQRSLRYLVYPTVPFALWLGFVAVRVGNPLESADNLALPLQGMVESFDTWQEVTGPQLFLTIVTVLGLVLGIVTLLRGRRLGGWLVGPWVLLALVSSHLVWDLGNNAIRTLAPLFTLGALGPFLDRVKVRPDAPETSTPR